MVKLDPLTGEQTEIAYTVERDVTGFSHQGDHTLAAAGNRSFAFFDRQAGQLSVTETESTCDLLSLTEKTALVGSLGSPVLRILTLEDHPEATVLRYDPSGSHAEARLSADGKTVMLYSRGSWQI